MQITCTSLQTNNHASTSSVIFTGRMLFLASKALKATNNANVTVQEFFKQLLRVLSLAWQLALLSSRAWQFFE